MHIVITANTSWNVVNFRSELLSRLIADGHVVTVISPRDSSVSLLREFGCEHQHIQMTSRGINFLGELITLAQLFFFFARRRPDVVLGFTVKNNIWGAIAARFCGVCFIPNITGLGSSFMGRALLEFFIKKLYRFAYKKIFMCFFQNEEDRNLFVEAGIISNKKTKVLPGSGINTAIFQPCAQRADCDEIIFVMISRVLPEKGVAEFIKACELFSRSEIPAKFYYLGGIGVDKPNKDQLNLLRELRSSQRITYLDQIEDVKPYIALSDCVVLPSYREGRPRALLEAMAMAKPIITCDTAGCRDLVEAGKNGILVEVGSASSLADGLVTMATTAPAVRREMGLQSRRKVEVEYSVEHVVAAYVNVINDVEASKRRTM